MTGDGAPRVGFVGLGRMGVPMAQRMIDAGFDVHVWNRSADRASALRGRVTVAPTPAALCRHAEVIVTMVADGTAAEAVFEGSAGLLAAAGPGTLVIEMSTIGPVLARRLAQRLEAVDAAMLDAPVSGSVPAATAGTLVAMVGGSPDAFARADRVLEPLTARRIHLGPSGTGAAMKLALNSVLAAVNQALAEGLVLAERSGVDGGLAWEVFAHSAVGAPYVTYKREAFVGGGAQPVTFTAALMRKDVNLADEVAQSLGVPLLMAGAANAMLTIACATGRADDDLAAVVDMLRGFGG